MSLTTEQLKERLSYVTGSDAAVICGVSKWGSIVELWQEKLGLKEVEDISYLSYIKAGNYLESAIIKWFEDETGKKVNKADGLIVHPELTFMAGNVDGLIEGEKAIIEVKTARSATGWGEQGDNIIPHYYMCQIAHYMAVTNSDRAYVAVLIGGHDFRWYTIERNKSLEEAIIKKESEFWECVQRQIPPEPRSAEDILKLYREALIEDPLIATLEIETMVGEILAAKATVKQTQEFIQARENSVKLFMKTYDRLHDCTGNLIATWKNCKGPTRFNAKLFSEEYPDIYENYLTTSEDSRRFVIKGDK